jgi:thiamine-phosphate pyrophosphorylase
MEEVRRAAGNGVDLILFGPVFEKRVADVVVVEGLGLDALQEACAAAEGTPVLALGGVTWPRAELCIEAGAAGVAGIRLFG